MTLEQVKRMYEEELEKRTRSAASYAPSFETSTLRITYENGQQLLSLRDEFSLMFWRLYANGDVISGLDFGLPRVAYPYERWYLGQTAHRHDYLELSFVYRGSFAQTINGVEHVFREGDVWIMDRNCMHQEVMRGHDAFVVFVEIYAEFFDEMFRESFRNNPAGEFIKEALAEKRDENRFVHFAASQPSPEVERIFNYILEERDRGLPGSNYVIKGLLISLFAILAANYSFSVTEKEQKKLDDQVYHEVISYLRRNCHDISLEALAKKFYLNRTYMSRMIQSGSGKSYKALLQELRLERAADPVREVANAVGYHNISYFYQLFQEKYQITPSDYRTRFRT